MSIDVTAPNGASVSFPDGTAAATINSVMMQHFGGGDPKAPAPPAPDPWAEFRVR